MDRAIDPIVRRQIILRRATAALIAVSAIAALFIYAPTLIRPSINRIRIRTAKVEQGSIEAAITASGIVAPEFEQVLSSPIDSRIMKILKRPGDKLSKGDPIVELDVSESVLALERLNQQIELKRNQQTKARLELENSLIGLQSQWEIKNLEHRSFGSIVERNRSLYKQGLMAEDKVRESELLEEKARFELKQLEDSKRNAEQSNKTQIEGLALEMQTLEKERDDARRRLELATTKSDRDGVLTWVVNEEGATMQKGSVLARIADLNSFRVEATVSDVHADKLSVGLPAVVKINDDYLEGSIASIQPTIKNGAVTFLVALKERSNSLLRSNLRVDVLVITERKEKALRIKKGPFANSEGVRNVFVIRGDAAVRTPVQFGISSYDYYEVVQGLMEGDEVIISDMSDYMYLKEAKLK